MTRAISLPLAVCLTLGLLFLPAVHIGQMTAAAHGLLPPLLLSICAGFVHGLGYQPVRPWLGGLLHPALLWPAMVGLAFLWVRSL